MTSKSKILLLYSSAGGGHFKAAEAIYNHLKAQGNADVQIVDALNYTHPWYKVMYRESYAMMITKFPGLWGFFFTLIDIPWLLGPVRLARRMLNAVVGFKLARFLRLGDFDCVMCTHFFPTEVAGYLKRTGKIRAKVVTVITDYDVHSIWLARGVDVYTGACAFTRKRLLELGISDGRIVISGIPSDERFAQKRTKADVRRKLGLKEDVFTVLVATGSFGIGPIAQVAHALRAECQVMVVCGHNKALYGRLVGENGDNLKVFGLVNNMDELMAAADLMITKPGGLSITEAMVVGLPLIFFNVIPGQEAGNVRVLGEHGVGLSGCTIERMRQEVKRLRDDRALYEEVRSRSLTLARPDAAGAISDMALS